MSNTNIKLSVIGGDSEKKDNYDEWLKSLNINNSEIIQYKTLRAIHDFCEEDVKKEIDDLLERESKKKLEEAEKELKRIKEENEKKNEIKEKDEIEEEDIKNNLLIMVVGDNDSGKTTLIQRFIKGDTKNLKIGKTVAIKVETKIIKYTINNEDQKICIQIQENPINSAKLKEMDLSYITQCDSIILTVDFSKAISIDNLKIWYDLLYNYNKKSSYFFIANKIRFISTRTNFSNK